jgi:hypothetical protein
MCNLYSITTNQAAIIALFQVINRYRRPAIMPAVFLGVLICSADARRDKPISPLRACRFLN